MIYKKNVHEIVHKIICKPYIPPVTPVADFRVRLARVLRSNEGLLGDTLGDTSGLARLCVPALGGGVVEV